MEKKIRKKIQIISTLDNTKMDKKKNKTIKNLNRFTREANKL